MEQFAVEPSNLVPGSEQSRQNALGSNVLLSRRARYRIGANYNQLPVNAPVAPLHSYSKDGAMRYVKVSDPGVRTKLQGRPAADTGRYGESAGWHADGEMVRTAYSLHAEDDDCCQATTLVREVMNDAQRDPLVSTSLDTSSTGSASRCSSASLSTGATWIPILVCASKRVSAVGTLERQAIWQGPCEAEKP